MLQNLPSVRLSAGAQTHASCASVTRLCPATATLPTPTYSLIETPDPTEGVSNHKRIIFRKFQKGLKTVFTHSENMPSKYMQGLRIYVKGDRSALSRALDFLSHWWCAASYTLSLRAAALPSLLYVSSLPDKRQGPPAL